MRIRVKGVPAGPALCRRRPLLATELATAFDRPIGRICLVDSLGYADPVSPDPLRPRTVRRRHPSAGVFALGFLAFLGSGCSDDVGRPPARTSTAADDDKAAAARRGGLAAGPAPSDRRKEAGPLPLTTARFIDRAEQAGLNFTYRNGQEAGHFAILESLGGGAGVVDFDGDGRMDVFLPGGGEFGEDGSISGRPPGLYRGVGDWRYVAATEPAGVDQAPWYSHGAAVTDFDHDGFPDILVTGYGGLLLFRNDGDGTFHEAGRESGLTDSLWGSSAAWGDLTGDGNPDLYVAHYVNWSFGNDPFCPGPEGKRDVCPPRGFEPLPDELFVSNGDGTFREASREAGLREDGKGLGVLMADVDLDGDLDVYVANDTVENFLYLNDGSGHLDEQSLMTGTGLGQAGTPDGSMGVDLGDYNLDGLPDLWVANYERESFALYRNVGHGVFLHSSHAAGVTAVGAQFVGWGTLFFDFDHDGDEDVFVSNGHVIRNPKAAPLRQMPLLFQNEAGRFQNVAPIAGGYTSSPHMGRGVAAGDLDGDGDLDLVVSNVNEPVAALENDSTGSRSWLGLRLIGRTSAREPAGAVVSVVTSSGRQTRQKKGGGSYASTHDPRLFFGLGAAERADEVEIRWPSGAVQTLRDVPARQVLTVVESGPGD